MRGLFKSPYEIAEKKLRDVTAVLKDGETLASGVSSGQVRGQCRDHFYAVGRRVPEEVRGKLI